MILLLNKHPADPIQQITSQLMQPIPIEIWQHILSFSTFKNQITLTRISKIFHEKLQIHEFYHIDPKYLKLLTNHIITHYPQIRSLDVEDNPNITNINHLTQLTKLNASGFCGLDDHGINQLNIIELDVCDNPKIININHMTQLKKLNAGGHCGLDDSGITRLNLIELDVRNKPNKS